MSRPATLKMPTDSSASQIRRKVAWNEERAIHVPDFYTVGYLGRTREQVIDSLLGASVGCVVDIRYTPVSMYRPEFSKRNLESALGEAGIEYVHIRELGVPREIRVLAVESGTRQTIWDWYDAHVANPMLGKNLEALLRCADGRRVALLCVELDPTACHRHRLAVALEGRGLRAHDL